MSNGRFTRVAECFKGFGFVCDLQICQFLFFSECLKGMSRNESIGPGDSRVRGDMLCVEQMVATLPANHQNGQKPLNISTESFSLIPAWSTSAGDRRSGRTPNRIMFNHFSDAVLFHNSIALSRHALLNGTDFSTMPSDWAKNQFPRKTYQRKNWWSFPFRLACYTC